MSHDTQCSWCIQSITSSKISLLSYLAAKTKQPNQHFSARQPQCAYIALPQPSSTGQTRTYSAPAHLLDRQVLRQHRHAPRVHAVGHVCGGVNRDLTQMAKKVSGDIHSMLLVMVLVMKRMSARRLMLHVLLYDNIYIEAYVALYAVIHKV